MVPSNVKQTALYPTLFCYISAIYILPNWYLLSVKLEHDVHANIDRLAAAYDNVGLAISLKKDVMHRHKKAPKSRYKYKSHKSQ